MRRRGGGAAAAGKAARCGQAMIESVIVMLVICLLLFGLLQLGHAFVNREVLRHAAARAARARTVGFNRWMVTKVMRVAAIPNAGRMTEPDEAFPDAALATAVTTLGPGALWDWSLGTSPRSQRAAFECARMPEYLGSENRERADVILDYENWDSITGQNLGGGAIAPIDGTLEVRVRQTYPLTIFVRMLYDWVGALTPTLDSGVLRLHGEYEMENHYPLYLEDQGF